MSRLRSLQSPSVRNPTSSPSPSKQSRHPPRNNATPFPQDVTTWHRKLRLLVNELRGCMDGWDEAVRDTFDELVGVVNEGTEMDNIIDTPASLSRPLLSPHYRNYQSHLSSLESHLTRLTKILSKLRMIQETARSLLSDSLNLRPVEFSLVVPLYSASTSGQGSGTGAGGGTGTWTLENFVDSLDPVAKYHSLHLHALQAQIGLILHPHGSGSHVSNSSSIFETQKLALESFRDQMARSPKQQWRVEWEELVLLEMSGGAGLDGDQQDEDDEEGEEGYDYDPGTPGSRHSKRGRGGSVGLD